MRSVPKYVIIVTYFLIGAMLGAFMTLDLNIFTFAFIAYIAITHGKRAFSKPGGAIVHMGVPLLGIFCGTIGAIIFQPLALELSLLATIIVYLLPSAVYLSAAMVSYYIVEWFFKIEEHS